MILYSEDFSGWLNFTLIAFLIKRYVNIKLQLISFTAAIGSPIVLGLNNTPDRVPDLCLFYNSDFIVYSSLSSFYIPCIIMVFLYWNIFKVSRVENWYNSAMHAHSYVSTKKAIKQNARKYSSNYQDIYAFKTTATAK